MSFYTLPVFLIKQTKIRNGNLIILGFKQVCPRSTQHQVAERRNIKPCFAAIKNFFMKQKN